VRRWTDKFLWTGKVNVDNLARGGAPSPLADLFGDDKSAGVQLFP
jgi:hypothetical protein